MPRTPQSLVVIVGRPNVGKSTLFNRLVGRRTAIVENQPGATRDRHYRDAELGDRVVTLVDTGGFIPERGATPLETHIRQQAEVAVQEGDVVLFLVDGRAGCSAGDQVIAAYLRREGRRVVLAVNKVDVPGDSPILTADFFSLGLGEPVAVSAEHGEGMEELRERLASALPPLAPASDYSPAEEGTRIAIVGRPNVGKSTLVNALLGQERVIVSPVAGTTRDPIDTELLVGERQVVLTDTAGIRRKSAITQRVEHFSVLGALRAVESADVVVLVLDASEPAVDQDLKIAALAEEKGRSLLIVVNKWDLVHGKTSEEVFRASLKWYMRFVSWAPLLFVSAKTAQRVAKVLEVALTLADQQRFRAPTPLLNKALQHIKTEHPLPVSRGKQLRLYYAAQVGDSPPAFAIVCNEPRIVPDRFKRYVAGYLRETFHLRVPIRLFWRERPAKEQRAAVGRRFKARAQHRRR